MTTRRAGSSIRTACSSLVNVHMQGQRDVGGGHRRTRCRRRQTAWWRPAPGLSWAPTPSSRCLFKYRISCKLSNSLISTSERLLLFFGRRFFNIHIDENKSLDDRHRGGLLFCRIWYTIICKPTAELVNLLIHVLSMSRASKTCSHTAGWVHHPQAASSGICICLCLKIVGLCHEA